MSKKVCVGISFDKDILMQIDKDRGEISRSRYLLKLLSKFIHEKRNIDSLDSNPEKSVSSESIGG